MDGILNLYEDDERFFYEKKKLEIFLKTFSAVSYDFFLAQLREDVYVQLLSVLNPLFLKRDYSSVLRCLKQAYENRDIICSLQGKISPALLFFPYCNDEICNESLLGLLSEHTERTIVPEIHIDLLDNHLFLKVAHVPYPTGYIYQYKADGADDLIGSTCAELIYTDNNREYIIARVGVFLGKDKALISCIQNRKIGRIHYSVRSHLREIENFFEIPLFFLSHILSRGTSKIIWLFQDSVHNCRIYTMKNGGFRPMYDQLGQVHKMNQVGEVFWQTEAATLKKHYNYIEGLFSKDSIQQSIDI